DASARKGAIRRPAATAVIRNASFHTMSCRYWYSTHRYDTTSRGSLSSNRRGRGVSAGAGSVTQRPLWRQRDLSLIGEAACRRLVPAAILWRIPTFGTALGLTARCDRLRAAG